jgi:hypothetical protein
LLVFLLDLVENIGLHLLNVFDKLEHLVVSDLEVALITDELLSFIRFCEAALILSASVTYCAGTPAAVVTSFAHDATKFLS